MVKIKKCDFVKKELKFLGHIISKEGIRIDPEKIAKMVALSLPTNRVPIGSVQFGFRLNRYRTDFSVIGLVNLPKFQFRFKLKPIPIGIYRKLNRFTDKF